MTEIKKPKVNSAAQQELDKADQTFKEFESSVKEMTMDRMNQAPKEEKESNAKLSSREIADAKDIYLKPLKSISRREKFNEKFRDEYNFQKEYVQFIAEHNENNSVIECWTGPYAGMPAEYWEVPVNVPVWGPRYLAEQIKRKVYHRMETKESITENVGVGSMYGKIVVDKTINRLDARPVTKRKSIFMGASGF